MKPLQSNVHFGNKSKNKQKKKKVKEIILIMALYVWKIHPQEFLVVGKGSSLFSEISIFGGRGESAHLWAYLDCIRSHSCSILNVVVSIQ